MKKGLFFALAIALGLTSCNNEDNFAMNEETTDRKSVVKGKSVSVSVELVVRLGLPTTNTYGESVSIMQR